MGRKKKVEEPEEIQPVEEQKEITNPALIKAMEMNDRLKKLNTGLGIMPVALDILKEDMEELVSLIQAGEEFQVETTDQSDDLETGSAETE